MELLYLYLARRDKKGAKVLTILRMGSNSGGPMSPVRVTDIGILQLPHDVKTELDSLIYDNRMEWEPWIESASSYQVLKTSLEKRGYSNVPIHSMPAAESTNLHKPHGANISKMPATKVMLQKPKRLW